MTDTYDSETMLKEGMKVQMTKLMNSVKKLQSAISTCDEIDFYNNNEGSSELLSPVVEAERALNNISTNMRQIKNIQMWDEQKTSC